MNKIAILFLLLGCFLFNGCLASRGYTPNEDVNSIESSRKYAITFSIEYIPYVKEDVIDLKDDRIEWIKDYLEESGASYRDFPARSKYHIRFLVRLLPPETRHATDMGLIAGLSLFTIPVCSDRFYYDVSATFSLNDELICTPSTSEKISEFIWLPLFPALFYPPVYVRKSVEKRCYRYLINEILEEHKQVVAKTSKSASNKTTSSNTNTASKNAGTKE